MNKAGIFITVRLASTRLPYKAVKEVAGKKILEFLIDRIKAFNANEEIFICTTKLPEDSLLDMVASQNDVNCYHGHADNLLQRHLACAMENGIEFIVNVDGDDIFCNPELIGRVISLYLSTKGQYDIIKTIDYPFGTNVMAYKTEVLRKIIENKENEKIDTGWGSLFNDSRFNIYIIQAEEDEQDQVRLTLDYEEDFLLFKHLIESLNMANQVVKQNDIINYIKSNPETRNINSDCDEKYWENFHAKVKEEGR